MCRLKTAKFLIQIIDELDLETTLGIILITWSQSQIKVKGGLT